MAGGIALVPPKRLPYSNDMWPLHPEYAQLPPDADGNRPGFPRLPLLEGNRVVNREVTGEEQTQLTTWYTQRAVDFIDRNAARPFFLYVPYSMATIGRELFDLEHDPGETVNVADRYPEVVARLEHCADVAREELGDTLTNQPGSAVRAPGRLDAGDERLVW